MPAIDMADHICVGGEHNVFIDQTGTGNRGPARVNRALDSILARPSDHLTRGRSIFYATQPDLPQHGDASRCQLFKILLNHSMLDHRSPRMNSHAPGTKHRKCPLGKDGHRFHADHIFRPPRRVHLARGNHRSDSAMQVAVDPANLVLPRRPISGHRMHMAVDQSRH